MKDATSSGRGEVSMNTENMELNSLSMIVPQASGRERIHSLHLSTYGLVNFEAFTSLHKAM